MDYKEISEFQEALKHPIFFPEKFKSWVTDYPTLNIPKLPISQVYGYVLEKVKTSELPAQGTVATTAWQNLDDEEGPSITGAADGTYIIMFGMFYNFQGSPDGFMGISVNGEDPDSSHLIRLSLNIFLNASHAFIVTANNDNNNSFIAKYKTASAGNVNISRRWLITMKVIEHE